MIARIAEMLRDEIASLNFIEISAGLVKPVPVKVNTTDPEDNTPTTITKYVPMVHNDVGNYCERGELYPLVPNTKKKSIIWWEDNGIDMVEEQTYYYQCRASLMCVAWFNLPLINSTYTDASILAANIIAAIPERITNVDYFSQIRVAFKGEVPSGAEVISKYNFSEDENQFATFPYAVIGLNFEVDFAFGKNCVDTAVIAASPCPPKMVIEELLNFDGVNDFVLLAEVDGVYGDAVLSFSMYIPPGEDFSGGSQIPIAFNNATFSDGIVIFLFNDGTIPRMNVLGKIGLGTVTVPLSGLVGIKLNIKINKTLGVISNVIINGISYSSYNGAGIAVTSQRYIGCRGGTANFFKGCIWDIKVKNEALWRGYPDGNTNGAWEDQIGTNDGTVFGTPTTINL